MWLEAPDPTNRRDIARSFRSTFLMDAFTQWTITSELFCEADREALRLGLRFILAIPLLVPVLPQLRDQEIRGF
jgi:hypothetical protein